MNTTIAREMGTQPRTTRAPIGRIVAIEGSEATVGVTATSHSAEGDHVTVGKFIGLLSGPCIIVGMVTQIAEETAAHHGAVCRQIARLDLVGEISANEKGTARFQRGVADYPTIGDGAILLSENELRLIYGSPDGDRAHIGDLQQNDRIGVNIDVDSLISRHFALLGATGVGKSSGVAVILQKILETRPNLRIFLVDPHNEYGRCFGDKAQVLTPRSLRLPFWLFNFEETVDAFFGGRPGIDEEVEILSEAIPEAKAAYVQLKGSQDRSLTKKKDAKETGYGVDTPVPYRIEDLITVIDDRMGKLENRSRIIFYSKLLQRIKTFRNHPRYGFMFENATVSGDTMADVVGHLFRIPANGKPMTIMQL